MAGKTNPWHKQIITRRKRLGEEGMETFVVNLPEKGHNIFVGNINAAILEA